MRGKIIAAGFGLFRASRVDRLLAPLTRGLGAILMFHHVRPRRDGEAGFAPNRLLEITPEFLDSVLITLRRHGFEILDMDAALTRITRPQPRQSPFAVLTFDDGYRDNYTHALPVLQRHRAPFTLFVTTGFAERRARMWWSELERAVARAKEVDVAFGAERLRVPAATPEQKNFAFAMLYRRLRAGPEDVLLEVIGDLARRNGVDGRALVAAECMDFEEIRQIAADPLCTIGAHTLTHPMLAKHDKDFVANELRGSRLLLSKRLGRDIRHLAYPVGDPTSAGPREFSIARELGYASAVTTRPGMVFADHAAHLTALPRLSINGLWQDIGYVETLLSGAPFALWNRGRRLNVA